MKPVAQSSRRVGNSVRRAKFGEQLAAAGAEAPAAA